ncbi:MAG: hypothetical protein GY830_02850 [Bacteroidetes bacterium]|nr:hypothetical protein [Bacteroidota bacterium]
MNLNFIYYLKSLLSRTKMKYFNKIFFLIIGINIFMYYCNSNDDQNQNEDMDELNENIQIPQDPLKLDDKNKKEIMKKEIETSKINYQETNISKLIQQQNFKEAIKYINVLESKDKDKINNDELDYIDESYKIIFITLINNGDQVSLNKFQEFYAKSKNKIYEYFKKDKANFICIKDTIKTLLENQQNELAKTIFNDLLDKISYLHIEVRMLITQKILQNANIDKILNIDENIIKNEEKKERIEYKALICNIENNLNFKTLKPAKEAIEYFLINLEYEENKISLINGITQKISFFIESEDNKVKKEIFDIFRVMLNNITIDKINSNMKLKLGKFTKSIDLLLKNDKTTLNKEQSNKLSNLKK